MKTEKRIEQFHFEKKEVEREKQIKDVERMADKESRKKETDKGNMKTDQNKKKKAISNVFNYDSSDYLDRSRCLDSQKSDAL